jgi:hypothetical protein
MEKGNRTPAGESQPAQANSIRNGQERGDALTNTPQPQSTSAAAQRGENRGPNDDDDDLAQARDESVEADA